MLRELDINSNPVQLQYDWNPEFPRSWVSAQKFDLYVKDLLLQRQLIFWILSKWRRFKTGISFGV